jgi:anti-sigma regulatory factor (Ser/Thr protein kinase)
MAEHARGLEIRQYITRNVEAHPSTVVQLTAAHFDIKDRAINLHVKKLVTDGILTPIGKTRNRKYALRVLSDWDKFYEIKPGLTEDLVWDDVRPHMGSLPANVLDIWNGGVTEMFNNVIDHSEGTGALVKVERTAINTEVAIHDNGVGIFKKIQREKNLDDPRHAILELSKGKLTTAPDHHSGIGIFFTSRMFDKFDISSQGLFFTHEAEHHHLDMLSQAQDRDNGTTIWMKIANDSKRTTKEIYDKFADPEEDDYGFARTIVPIKFAKYSGDRLVSRSQAKMVLAGLNKFKVVSFDFRDVDSVGQAFADEIFRVFAKAHPDMQLLSIHANDRVSDMIKMAVSGRPSNVNE